MRLKKKYWIALFVVFGIIVTRAMVKSADPPFELYPLPAIPVSQGCFAVSDNMVKHIAKIKAKTGRPILLYA